MSELNININIQYLVATILVVVSICIYLSHKITYFFDFINYHKLENQFILIKFEIREFVDSIEIFRGINRLKLQEKRQNILNNLATLENDLIKTSFFTEIYKSKYPILYDKIQDQIKFVDSISININFAVQVLPIRETLFFPSN